MQNQDPICTSGVLVECQAAELSVPTLTVLTAGPCRLTGASTVDGVDAVSCSCSHSPKAAFVCLMMFGGSPAAAALPTKVPSGAMQSPCCMEADTAGALPEAAWDNAVGLGALLVALPCCAAAVDAVWPAAVLTCADPGTPCATCTTRVTGVV